MQCIIREPVDCGSPSQWLVINKIIGERWRRFLWFFLICMSFCTVSFMTSSLFFSPSLPSQHHRHHHRSSSAGVANDTLSCGGGSPVWRIQTESSSRHGAAGLGESGGVRTPVRSRDAVFVFGGRKSRGGFRCFASLLVTFALCQFYPLTLFHPARLFFLFFSLLPPRILLLALENISPYVFISVILTKTTVMSAQAAPFTHTIQHITHLDGKMFITPFPIIFLQIKVSQWHLFP